MYTSQICLLLIQKFQHKNHGTTPLIELEKSESVIKEIESIEIRNIIAETYFTMITANHESFIWSPTNAISYGSLLQHLQLIWQFDQETIMFFNKLFQIIDMN